MVYAMTQNKELLSTVE